MLDKRKAGMDDEKRGGRGMSEVLQNGKRKRPAWDYRAGTWEERSPVSIQLEMAESCRNVMEQIRDELKQLNSLLACPNFTGIPSTLKRISRNTAKTTKKKSGRS